jgi:hypothetical protein
LIDCLVLLIALLLFRYKVGPLNLLVRRSYQNYRRRGVPSPEGKVTPADVHVSVEQMYDDGVVYDRRRNRRRWGNPQEVAITTTTHPIEQVHGIVVNRSDRGVALLVDKAFAPETLLNVRSVEAPADVPWVCVEVRHCRTAGKNWKLGCRFQEAPPWKVLAWFG